MIQQSYIENYVEQPLFDKPQSARSRFILNVLNKGLTALYGILISYASAVATGFYIFIDNLEEHGHHFTSQN